MQMGHYGKLTSLFVLLIAVTFLLEGLGVFDQSFVDIVWPILLGVIALLWMSDHHR